MLTNSTLWESKNADTDIIVYILQMKTIPCLVLKMGRYYQHYHKGSLDSVAIRYSSEGALQPY